MTKEQRPVLKLNTLSPELATKLALMNPNP